MATRYKLTTREMKTGLGWNETTWKIGEWQEAHGKNVERLCTSAWIHWYHHPLLAVLLNPIHAALSDPRLWEVETDGVSLEEPGQKGGSRRVRLIKELELPKITQEQLVTIAILCAKQVYTDQQWVTWADKWLSGEDRSHNSAYDTYGERMKYHWDRGSACSAAKLARVAASDSTEDYSYCKGNAAEAILHAITATDGKLDVIAIAEQVLAAKAPEPAKQPEVTP